MSSNFFILGFSRFAVGFFQIFICIYFPVWVDTFGAENQKSIWLTILLLAPPLGVVIGYSMTALLIAKASWHWTFYVQAVCLVPCFMGFLLTPEKYMDID